MMNRRGAWHAPWLHTISIQDRANTVRPYKQPKKEKKMEVPAGMKETHHLMVEFTDAKSGKNLSEGEVKLKIQGPDKSEQTKDLMGMPGMTGMGAGFGADLVMDKKGKYGVMAKFKLKDGKVRQV